MISKTGSKICEPIRDLNHSKAYVLRYNSNFKEYEAWICSFLDENVYLQHSSLVHMLGEIMIDPYLEINDWTHFTQKWICYMMMQTLYANNAVVLLFYFPCQAIIKSVNWFQKRCACLLHITYQLSRNISQTTFICLAYWLNHGNLFAKTFYSVIISINYIFHLPRIFFFFFK